ncbi:MAG: peroxidase family protein [Thiotrichaceae bacterium]
MQSLDKKSQSSLESLLEKLAKMFETGESYNRRRGGARSNLGTSGDDQLNGNNRSNTIKGLAGNDVIKGRGGNDRLLGGAGNDRLLGGRGNDRLYGGSGNDTVSGGRGRDRLFGNAGNDILKGGRGNDVFVDNEGNNTIKGGRGRDVVRFNGNFDDYTIMSRGKSFVFENKQTGNINTVSEVERFAFRDQSLSLSTLKESYVGGKDTRYHSYDGSFNNLRNPDIGKVDSPYRYIAPKDESRAMGGAQESSLPNPREVSNAVFSQEGLTENDKGLSDMFWLWGQFLDHDINLTPTLEAEKADIAIPKGDPLFDPESTGDKTMPFARSVYITDENGVRKQTNHITAVIDGSNIYGSSKEVQDEIRSFNEGKLTVDAADRLPKDEKGHFVSGDERVNENVGLTSMHTIWAREHNRVADQLSTENPSWNDEELFQEARKKVVGEMQAITANEFYPKLLGGSGLNDYRGYNPDVSPQISNEFASAAYRFGHTMLSPSILRLDAEGKEIAEGNLQLRDAFFRPDKVEEAGVDPILRGFADHTAQAADAKIVDDVRNFLFGPPGSGGFDLASLNIQRGRDHGISGYNDVREALGLSRITSFDDPIFKGDSGQRLASVYSSPDQVDLWVGGLAEKGNGDALFGSTFSTILNDQFSRLRDGDRFWYQNRFSGAELNELNNLKLSDIIERNTGIQQIQDDVFVASNNFVQPVIGDAVHVDLNSSLVFSGTTGEAAGSTEAIRSVAEIATNTVQVSSSEANIIISNALEVEDAEEALEESATTSDAELVQAGILPQ